MTFRAKISFSIGVDITEIVGLYFLYFHCDEKCDKASLNMGGDGISNI